MTPRPNRKLIDLDAYRRLGRPEPDPREQHEDQLQIRTLLVVMAIGLACWALLVWALVRWWP